MRQSNASRESKDGTHTYRSVSTARRPARYLLRPGAAGSGRPRAVGVPSRTGSRLRRRRTGAFAQGTRPLRRRRRVSPRGGRGGAAPSRSRRHGRCGDRWSSVHARLVRRGDFRRRAGTLDRPVACAGRGGGFTVARRPYDRQHPQCAESGRGMAAVARPVGLPGTRYSGPRPSALLHAARRPRPIRAGGPNDGSRRLSLPADVAARSANFRHRRARADVFRAAISRRWP